MNEWMNEILHETKDTIIMSIIANNMESDWRAPVNNTACDNMARKYVTKGA